MLLRFVQAASAKNVYFFPWAEKFLLSRDGPGNYHKFLVSF
jgi:hypothetical protein